MTLRKLLLGALLLGCISCNQKETGTLDTYVVMVSFDGFRWDYANLYHTPHFDAMAKAGVKAERMIPSFPTSTFPNHYTLATGLYPDNHGIINNSFYAEDLGGVYRIAAANMVTNPKAYFGEPIWVTAEKQGVRSASYFWVGSEAAIGGIEPTYWEAYNGSIPYVDRVDQVIKWLTLPVHKRPGFVLLYFDEPDGTGHHYGPDHESTGQVVEYLDSILGYLRREISALEFGDRVNLIVLSDHGMGSTSGKQYINLRKYLKDGWTEKMVGGHPIILIDPADGFADSITHALDPVKGVRAMQKDDIPERLHYGNNPRFPGIVVLADSMRVIGTRDNPSGYSAGAHGYDNAYSAMHTIFYADGPAFKDGYVHGEFPNVDVYSIIAHILDLEPAKTNGELDRVSGMFRTEKTTP
jgi:alkaline phosphatase D